jgi:hypothetical protein
MATPCSIPTSRTLSTSDASSVGRPSDMAMAGACHTLNMERGDLSNTAILARCLYGETSAAPSVLLVVPKCDERIDAAGT